MADVSSTNLIRSCQSANCLLVITVKRITPNLVPFGTPPYRNFQSDDVASILKTCCLSVRNGAIQLRSAESTSCFRSSIIKMLWSIKLKPLQKPIKKSRFQNHRNLSLRSWLETWKRASVAECPLRAKCRKSIFLSNCSSSSLHVNPSMTLASVHVTEIGRRSLLIFGAGPNLVFRVFSY